MKITVQVVLHADDDTETVVREAFTVQRGALAPETLGLQLEGAKDLLSRVQDTLVEHQVAAALASAASCPDCGIPHRHKDSRPIVIRTLSHCLGIATSRPPGRLSRTSPPARGLSEEAPHLSRHRQPPARIGQNDPVRETLPGPPDAPEGITHARPCP